MGKLHTNITCKSKGEWISIIEFKNDNGGLFINSFKKGKSVFEKNGLKKKDIVKKIVCLDDSGHETEISYDSLQNLQAPATLIFTVERGKGKKTQVLTIEIPVEWNEDELKLL